jgi:hypothetical protein
MQTINLHGINLHISRQPIPQPCLRLADDLWLAGRLQKDELVQAAGMDETKIDFAIPRLWIRATGADPNDYVWSYERNPVFGEAVSIESVLEKLAEIIRKEIK